MASDSNNGAVGLKPTSGLCGKATMDQEENADVDFTEALLKLRRKPTSSNQLTELIEASKQEAYKLAKPKADAKAGIKKSKRFDLALRQAGHLDLARAIKSCSRKVPCGSTYCPKCRANLASRLLVRTNKNLIGRLGSDQKLVHAQVHYMTGLVAITSLDAGDINHAIREARGNFEAAAKRRPWFRVEGAFELELVHFVHMDKMNAKYSPQKKATLEAMIAGTLIRALYEEDGYVVLVHWHALVSGLYDVAGGRSQKKPMKRCAFDVLQSYYGKHPRQLHAQKLQAPTASRPLSSHVDKICSYPFKDAHRLNYTFQGSKFANGEWIDLTSLGHFIAAYRAVGRVGNRGLAISYRGG
ncbi:MAG: hypothetical protein LCH86_06200 [Proteobacteria bacterium]|nr:hypothetical protein [Pseudomonadota bacterium]